MATKKTATATKTAAAKKTSAKKPVTIKQHGEGDHGEEACRYENERQEKAQPDRRGLGGFEEKPQTAFMQ